MTRGRRNRGAGRRRAMHEADPYVKQSRAQGWRSRAVHKLEDVDRRHTLFRPGQVVVDLGAAPGGWSQYAARCLDGRGRVLALDRLAMDPLPGVEFLQIDFETDAGVAALNERLGDARVDVVLSDMAPNLTGHASVDQPAAMALAELAEAFALEWLREDGALFVKLFQGEGFDAFRQRLGGAFRRTAVIKPDASRAASREVYFLARGRVL